MDNTTTGQDTVRPAKKKKRVFMWVFLAIQALFIVWIVSATAGASDNCAGEVGSALEACQAGTAVGAGIGIFLILFLWMIVDVILGVTYLITRRR